MGGSVASVNITFFSSHDLRPRATEVRRNRHTRLLLHSSWGCAKPSRRQNLRTRALHDENMLCGPLRAAKNHLIRAHPSVLEANLEANSVLELGGKLRVGGQLGACILAIGPSPSARAALSRPVTHQHRSCAPTEVKKLAGCCCRVN